MNRIFVLLGHEEVLAIKAINTLPHLSSLWKRYVEDTFTVMKTADKRSFLDHINSTDQNIQFSSEDSRTDGSMPFLDILVTPKKDGSLSTSVYRKPTHTDCYLQGDSHYTISSKYSVVGTLHHGTKTIFIALSCYNKRNNIYSKLLPNVSTLHGFSTE